MSKINLARYFFTYTLVLWSFACSETTPITDAAVDGPSVPDAFVDSSEDIDADAAMGTDATVDATLDGSIPQVSPFFGPNGLVRIADNEGGFPGGLLDPGDRFARDQDGAGDINGDGIEDLIIGARSDDDGGTDKGAAYILFMTAAGTVESYQKISELEGGFTGELEDRDFFGYGVAGIGDYDGDGIPDIAVSALGDNPRLYILHLNRDGTVKSMTLNSTVTAEGLSAADLNQDGKLDLIAGNSNADGFGAITFLFFDGASEVIAQDSVTIDSDTSNFGNNLIRGERFGGRASALLGDLDQDGTLELAVGSFQADDGIGAIWILSLDSATYEVESFVKVSPGLAGFDEVIPNDPNSNGTSGGHFGHAMVAPGDINGDGIPDLITGANQYGAGVGYVIYLNSDKTVKTFTRINATEGGFDLTLGEADRFSRSMALVNREDGKFTVNMGGGVSRGGSGAIYSLTFESCSIVPQEGSTFWSQGDTLFTNWDHNAQTVTGPLNYEQCVAKAFEVGAFNITAKDSDGRCIIKNDSAVLTDSEEGSQSYIRSCP